jgi:hypothetical protein
LLTPWLGSQIVAASRRLPQLAASVWVTALVVDAYLVATAWRLRRRFLADRPRTAAATLGL